MTAVPAGAEPAPTVAPVLRLVKHEHAWWLVDVEYDAGMTLHRFECRDCGDVRYT